MNKSKIKGTAAESAVVAYLRPNGFPHAERRALAGALDKGDLAGLVGLRGSLCGEVKDTAAADWSGQLNETVVEQGNAKADYGFLIRKRRGKSDVGQWYFMMTVEQGVRLLRQAGYGNPLDAA